MDSILIIVNKHQCHQARQVTAKIDIPTYAIVVGDAIFPKYNTVDKKKKREGATIEYHCHHRI
jgi:hypothetical protein